MSRFSSVALGFFLLLAPLAFTKTHHKALTPNDEAYTDPLFVNGDPTAMDTLIYHTQDIQASSPDWMKHFTTDAASPTSLQHYATPGQMLDATQNFDRLYRNTAFLFLVRQAQWDKPQSPKRKAEEIIPPLQAVCQMLVYRLGASTPIRTKIKAKGGDYLSYYLSLSQEKKLYAYMGIQAHPLPLLAHFLKGEIAYFFKFPKELQPKGYVPEPGNPDDLHFYTFAMGLDYYLPYWNKANALQTQYNALYRQYTQKLCAPPNDPRYQAALDLAQPYLPLIARYLLI